jgi:hypothetical protein
MSARSPAGFDNGRMSDAVLSRAVVIYVWGLNRRPWPSRDTEAVRQAFGEQALDLVPRIQAIFDMVDAAPANWSRGLNAATKRIETIVREVYPDLDDRRSERSAISSPMPTDRRARCGR